MKGMGHGIALAGAAALAITLGGCAKYGDGDAAANAESVKSAIKADETKWNEQFQSRDTEGLVGHYADDAFFVAPGVKPASGSIAIRKVYADAGSDKNFAVQFASDKIEASGDLAYARGHFTEKYTDPKTGQAMTGSGSYVTIYKKQQDGSWKVIEDLTASDPDTTKPVEPGKPVTRAKMVSF